MHSLIVQDRINSVNQRLAENGGRANTVESVCANGIGWAILNAYRRARQKNWDTIYWAIDLHDTVIEPSYESGKIGAACLHALDTLYWMMQFPETRIILWSSMSYEELSAHRDKLFEGHDPSVKNRVFLNQNTDIGETRYANFDQKMYFNILLDDKAGFNSKQDWITIQRALSAVRKAYPIFQQPEAE